MNFPTIELHDFVQLADNTISLLAAANMHVPSQLTTIAFHPATKTTTDHRPLRRAILNRKRRIRVRVPSGAVTQLVILPLSILGSYRMKIGEMEEEPILPTTTSAIIDYDSSVAPELEV